jgi:exodeoxyribonuclease VII small subunit
MSGEPESAEFEPALRRLEEIAARLDSDALELGEALKLFEEGVALLHAADSLLDRAATRVEQLTDAGGEPHTVPMEAAP